MRAFVAWLLGCFVLLAMPAAAEVRIERHTGEAQTLQALQAAPADQWVAADAIRNQGAPSFWRLRLDPPPAGGGDIVLALREAYDAKLVAWLPPDYTPRQISTFDTAWRQVGSRHRLALQLPAAAAGQPVYLQFVTGRSQPIRASDATLEQYVAEDLGRVRYTGLILTTLALLALVSAIFAVALRRWRLLAFGAWIVSCWVYTAVMTGEIVTLLPYPAFLAHAMVTSFVSTNLGLVAIYLFSIGFLDLPRRHPRTARAISVTLAAMLILTLIIIAAPYTAWALQGTNLSALVLAALGLGAAVARARAGSAEGWFFLLGLGTVTVVGMVRVAEFMVRAGTSPTMEWLHPAAYAFGAFVLLLATARAARYAEREMHAARSVAHTDALTLLPNRHQLRPGLEALVREAQAQDRPLSVMFLDLDHFKAINDRHGHALGDRCLVTLGRILRRHVRATDLVARYGGEEFVLALEGAGAARAADAAEELRAAVQADGREVDGVPVALTVSIGVAVLQPGEDIDALLARADAALYRAKQGGRNRVELDAAGAATAPVAA